jgi:4-amino-4-deoxy-L-arabinose transferase-like glycosyltransferase
MKRLLIPLILTILFIFLTSLDTKSVGIYYDELLHATSTQKMLKGRTYVSEISQVVTAKVLGREFPIMTLYYVGPLKAYALLPVFYLFGSNILTLRLTTSICAAISLVLFYILCKENVNSKTATIATIILALDPSFIFSARYDWGPVAIQQILKISVILITMRIIYTKDTTHKWYAYLMLGFVSGLLLWDKLNALWLLIPIGIVLLTHTLHTFTTYTRKNWGAVLTGGVLGALPLLVFIYKKPFFYRVSQDSFEHFEKYLQLNSDIPNLNYLLINYSSSLTDKIQTIHTTLNGTAIPHHILTEDIPSGVFAWITYIACITLILITIRNWKNRNDEDKKIATILVFTATILGFILITPHANGPHHVLMLWPFPHLIVACFITKALQKSKYIPYMIISLIIAGNGLVLYNFHYQVAQHNVRVYWSKDRDKSLIAYLQKESTPIYALDWGITLPIAFQTNGTLPIRDLQAFYEPKCDQIKQAMKENARFILYREEDKVFPLYYSECKGQFSQMSIEKADRYVIYSPIK